MPLSPVKQEESLEGRGHGCFISSSPRGPGSRSICTCSSQAHVPALECKPGTASGLCCSNSVSQASTLPVPVASLSLARGPGGWGGGSGAGVGAGCVALLQAAGLGVAWNWPGSRPQVGSRSVSCARNWRPRRTGQWLSGTSSSYGRRAGVRCKQAVFKTQGFAHGSPPKSHCIS
uniref:Uncharacterized protein n=1 Tax=Myotis myotis TaxID=51298 RepID=A0A7J7VIN8_MYOMY|nr:hypothetical protein mMyoMyo1_008332 [Myotis myotis]